MTESDRTSIRTRSRSSQRTSDEGALRMPHDEDAERALVASILLDVEQAKAECLDLIRDEMFSHPGYRDLTKVIRHRVKAGDGVDIVALAPLLPESIDPEDLPSLMFETVPSGANLMTHFFRVVEMYRRRKYWETGHRLVHQSTYRGKEGDSAELRRLCEQAVEEAEQVGALPRIHAVREVLPKALHEIRPESEREADEVLKTGIRRLDSMLVGGLRKSMLYILAARPSMGKTTLAWNMAADMALNGVPVLFVSLETREETLVQGLLSRSSGVNSYHLLRGRYDAMAAQRLSQAATDVERLPLHICDDSRVTPGGLRTMVRAAKSKFGVRAVFVDYLQLITPEGSGRESRQVEVSMISRDAKLLAMEQEIPIVMLAQLSRGVESRDNKRPLLSDLRESGSIEQDADVVAMLYREGYYDRSAPDDGKTELIVRKQRHGPLGTVPLRFTPAVSEFVEWEEELDQ